MWRQGERRGMSPAMESVSRQSRATPFANSFASSTREERFLAAGNGLPIFRPKHPTCVPYPSHVVRGRLAPWEVPRNEPVRLFPRRSAHEEDVARFPDSLGGGLVAGHGGS